MVPIRQAFLPISANARPGIVHKKMYIVVHITDNTRPTAGAKNHSDYLTNVAKTGYPYVSWQYTIDDHEIYQHIPDDEIAWHAGDGRTDLGGNMSGIGIELCVNSDGNYAQTIENGKELVAMLLKKYGWGVNQVKQHAFFVSKNCPSRIRNEGTWGSFIDGCQFYLNKLNAPEVVPVLPPQPQFVTVNTNWSPLWLRSVDLKKNMYLMPKGTRIELIKKDNPNWWLVKYNGITGRASAQYLK
jgi:N-acetylmuramoyl-L-alanine amidase